LAPVQAATVQQGNKNAGNPYHRTARTGQHRVGGRGCGLNRKGGGRRLKITGHPWPGREPPRPGRWERPPVNHENRRGFGLTENQAYPELCGGRSGRLTGRPPFGSAAPANERTGAAATKIDYSPARSAKVT
jgi:hypothetical protein